MLRGVLLWIVAQVDVRLTEERGRQLWRSKRAAACAASDVDTTGMSRRVGALTSLGMRSRCQASSSVNACSRTRELAVSRCSAADGRSSTSVTAATLGQASRAPVSRKRRIKSARSWSFLPDA